MPDLIPRQVPLLAALLAGVALAWSAAPANAEPDPDRPSSHKDELKRRRHGPPPEAFEACNERQEGDACTVALRDRTLSGSCLQARERDALFCMPDELPPPPPERD